MTLRFAPTGLIVALFLLPVSAFAEPGPAETYRLSLILHGMHSTYAEGLPHTGGWGVGGSLRYALSKSMKIRAGGEYVRTAHNGYSVVNILTPWTLGVEFGPRAPHRIEAFGRLGLGFYRLDKRGGREPFPGRPYSFAVHDNFGGVNFGAGTHVRLAGRSMLELGVTSHKIFGVQQSDIPSLGTSTLLNLQAGLVYTLK